MNAVDTLIVIGKVTLLAVCILAILYTSLSKRHWPIALGAGLCLVTQELFILSQKLGWAPRTGLLLYLATPALSCVMTMAVVRYRRDWILWIAFLAGILSEVSWILLAANHTEWWSYKLVEMPLGVLLVQAFTLYRGRIRVWTDLVYRVVLVFSIGDALYIVGRLLSLPWWVAATQAIVVNSAVIVIQLRGLVLTKPTNGSTPCHHTS